MLSRDVQPENISLIDVTPSGIVMLIRDEQKENDSLPIDVTLSGIVMLVREVQP